MHTHKHIGCYSPAERLQSTTHIMPGKSSLFNPLTESRLLHKELLAPKQQRCSIQKGISYKAHNDILCSIGQGNLVSCFGKTRQLFWLYIWAMVRIMETSNAPPMWVQLLGALNELKACLNRHKTESE